MGSTDGLLSPTTTAAYPAWYGGTVDDWPWYEVALAVMIMAGTFAFTSSCASHIVAAWGLRKDFNMAARSPLLLTMSGIVGILLSLALTWRVTLFPGEVVKVLEGSALEIVFVPLSTTGFTLVYGFRGLRLLIMHDRSMRRRWGGVPDEGSLVKALLVCYLAVEVMAWSASLAIGVSRVAGLTFVSIVVDMVLTAGICVALVGKLRTTHDIFCMSLELQKVGASALVVLVLAVVLQIVPAALQRHGMILTSMSRNLIPLWLSNMKPVRVILEAKADYTRSGISSLFPYLPGKASSKVAAVAARFSLSSRAGSPASTRSFQLDPEIARILNFPPLLKAFSDFCRRALCGESIDFLVAGKNFVATLRTSSSAADGNAEFDEFMMIIDKYIARYSPFEVNIDSRTKDDIFAKAAIFKELPLEEKIHILDAAEKEVGKMLQENLLQKFKATKEYEEIDAMVLSLTS